MGCTSTKNKRVPENMPNITSSIGRSPYGAPSTIQVGPGPLSAAGNLANGSVMLQPATVMTNSGAFTQQVGMVQPVSPGYLKPNMIQSGVGQQSSMLPVTVNPPVSVTTSKTTQVVTTNPTANVIPNQNFNPIPTVNPFPNQIGTSMNAPLNNLTNQYLNSQPQIKMNTNQVEVIGGMKEAAKAMSFTPVAVNQAPPTRPTYDVNSNYAIESTNVGGVNAYMDQRKLDMDMDTGSTGYTPKIFTYTYGNMMGGPLVGQGGNASQYY